MTKTINKRDSLHSPYKELDEVETHLSTATELSRGLWLLLWNQSNAGPIVGQSEDQRDLFALAELASQVAHHVSAANFLFHYPDEAKSEVVAIDITNLSVDGSTIDKSTSKKQEIHPWLLDAILDSMPTTECDSLAALIDGHRVSYSKFEEVCKELPDEIVSNVFDRVWEFRDRIIDWKPICLKEVDMRNEVIIDVMSSGSEWGEKELKRIFAPVCEPKSVVSRAA